MLNEDLISGDLIKVHEKLNDFAEHHQRLGGQNAYKLIRKMQDEMLLQPRDGSETEVIRTEGYNIAVEQILLLLAKIFFPKTPTDEKEYKTKGYVPEKEENRR